MSKQTQGSAAGNMYVTSSGSLALAPSDCTDGNLQIWFPDGSSTIVYGVVPCCFSYPNCNPCRPNDSWNEWLGTHFTPQCGSDNKNGCIVSEACSTT